MVLGMTQQVALVPVFLHFWSGETLAAWLVVYSVGYLILIADSGLQFRAINRFLAFKSSVDCDGRTARFYAAMLRIYYGLAAALRRVNGTVYSVEECNGLVLRRPVTRRDGIHESAERKLVYARIVGDGRTPAVETDVDRCQV